MSHIVKKLKHEEEESVDFSYIVNKINKRCSVNIKNEQYKEIENYLAFKWNYKCEDISEYYGRFDYNDELPSDEQKMPISYANTFFDNYYPIFVFKMGIMNNNYMNNIFTEKIKELENKID